MANLKTAEEIFVGLSITTISFAGQRKTGSKIGGGAADSADLNLTLFFGAPRKGSERIVVKLGKVGLEVRK